MVILTLNGAVEGDKVTIEPDNKERLHITVYKNSDPVQIHIINRELFLIWKKLYSTANTETRWLMDIAGMYFEKGNDNE